jgi:dienelactone hydrolase
MRKQNFLIFCLAFLSFTFSQSQAQNVFKTTNGSVIGYYEYLPPDYNSNSDKYPVMIFLHGIGERGITSTDPAVLSTTIASVAKLGPPMYVKNGHKFPFILISPQLKKSYGTWPASYVMEVINYVKTYLRIDEKRIYLTGLSLGGGGVWMTAQDNAALFAAIAPVCGGYNTPSKACNLASENLPVWAFHGDKDGIVPMSKSINMVNAINNCTPKPSPLAKITIYPGVGHSAWNNAYKIDNTVHNPNVYQWMLAYTNTSNRGNKIPVADAGDDVSVSALSTILTGSASDTDGTIASYTWTKVSGPSATLTNNLTKALTISNLTAGTYEFRLTAKDNSGNTDSDYVKVTVGGTANAVPVVNAGTDKTLTLPTNSVVLTGTATDTDGTIAAYAWSKVSGSTATLGGATTASLNVSALVAGSYVFRLTVTDNKGGKKSDDVTVTVKTSSTNIAPVANAGSDKTISLPTNTLNVTGSGTDADGTIKYYKWTKISGPYCYVYGVSKPTLQLSQMKAGTYTFKLTVTDNMGATGSDQVTIVLNDAITSATSFSAEPVNIISENTLAENLLNASADQTPVLGSNTMAQLENSTVVIFNGSGEQIYTGSWDSNSHRDVLHEKGLYIYNVIKEGKRMDAGKIYIRD